jgi:hypothetical protein
MCDENLNENSSAVVPNFTVVGFGVQAVEPMGIELRLVDLADHESVSISGCLTANYNPQSNQICVKLPIVGNQCVPSPVKFPGPVQVQACYTTCGKFIPTGVRVTFRVNGTVILTKVFGLC